MSNILPGDPFGLGLAQRMGVLQGMFNQRQHGLNMAMQIGQQAQGEIVQRREDALRTTMHNQQMQQQQNIFNQRQQELDEWRQQRIAQQQASLEERQRHDAARESQFDQGLELRGQEQQARQGRFDTHEQRLGSQFDQNQNRLRGNISVLAGIRQGRQQQADQNKITREDEAERHEAVKRLTMPGGEYFGRKIPDVGSPPEEQDAWDQAQIRSILKIRAEKGKGGPGNNPEEAQGGGVSEPPPFSDNGDQSSFWTRPPSLSGIEQVLSYPLRKSGEFFHTIGQGIDALPDLPSVGNTLLSGQNQLTYQNKLGEPLEKVAGGLNTAADIGTSKALETAGIDPEGTGGKIARDVAQYALLAGLHAATKSGASDIDPAILAQLKQPRTPGAVEAGQLASHLEENPEALQDKGVQEIPGVEKQVGMLERIRGEPKVLPPVPDEIASFAQQPIEQEISPKEPPLDYNKERILRLGEGEQRSPTLQQLHPEDPLRTSVEHEARMEPRNLNELLGQLPDDFIQDKIKQLKTQQRLESPQDAKITERLIDSYQTELDSRRIINTPVENADLLHNLESPETGSFSPKHYEDIGETPKDAKAYSQEDLGMFQQYMKQYGELSPEYVTNYRQSRGMELGGSTPNIKPNLFGRIPNEKDFDTIRNIKNQLRDMLIDPKTVRSKFGKEQMSGLIESLHNLGGYLPHQLFSDLKAAGLPVSRMYPKGYSERGAKYNALGDMISKGGEILKDFINEAPGSAADVNIAAQRYKLNRDVTKIVNPNNEPHMDFNAAENISTIGDPYKVRFLGARLDPNRNIPEIAHVMQKAVKEFNITEDNIKLFHAPQLINIKRGGNFDNTLMSVMRGSRPESDLFSIGGAEGHSPAQVLDAYNIFQKIDPAEWHQPYMKNVSSGLEGLESALRKEIFNKEIQPALGEGWKIANQYKERALNGDSNAERQWRVASGYLIRFREKYEEAEGLANNLMGWGKRLASLSQVGGNLGPVAANFFFGVAHAATNGDLKSSFKQYLANKTYINKMLATEGGFTHRQGVQWGTPEWGKVSQVLQKVEDKLYSGMNTTTLTTAGAKYISEMNKALPAGMQAGLDAVDLVNFTHEWALDRAREISHAGDMAFRAEVYNNPITSFMFQYTRPAWKTLDLLAFRYLPQAMRGEVGPLLRFSAVIGGTILIGDQMGLKLSDKLFWHLFTSYGHGESGKILNAAPGLKIPADIVNYLSELYNGKSDEQQRKENLYNAQSAKERMLTDLPGGSQGHAMYRAATDPDLSLWERIKRGSHIAPTESQAAQSNLLNKIKLGKYNPEKIKAEQEYNEAKRRASGKK